MEERKVNVFFSAYVAISIMFLARALAIINRSFCLELFLFHEIYNQHFIVITFFRTERRIFMSASCHIT